MKKYLMYFGVILLSLLAGWTSHSIWEEYRYEVFKPTFFDSYENFHYFYHFFSSDSVYQKEHTRLPLPYRVFIAEHYELYRQEKWKEWKFIHVPKDFETLLYDNFDGQMTGGRRLVMHQNTFYYFEFEKGTWYLIQIDEYI